MHEYVNIKVFGIIVRGITQYCPQILENSNVLHSVPKNADKIPVSIKKELLDLALEEGGADLVMKLARVLEGEPGSSPLLFFLLNSASPADIIRKLEQYDKYFHSSRQLRLVEDGDTQLTIDHIGHGSIRISASEDLFICGLLFYLLQKIGCQNLSILWKEINDPNTRKYLKDSRVISDSGRCRWLFQWDEFKAIASIPGLDSFLLNTLQPLSAEDASIRSQVTKVVLQDLNKKWELSDLAGQLNVSKRTLQRRLKHEGVSFAKLLNSLRIEQSMELLKNRELSLAEIGYLLGFSDSSHFSREFKKANGMTPLMYRQQGDKLELATITAG